MAEIPGTVKLTGIIAPSDDADTYAVQEDKWGKGGHRAVADSTERDAISADRRKEGMLVYVTGDTTLYVLTGGTSNGDWHEFAGGGGGVTDHGALTGLDDDDHSLYEHTGHTHVPSGGTILSGGAMDGQTLVWRDSIDAWSGETQAAGVTDHGLLSGLDDDDHSHYHTSGRAETWLTTEAHSGDISGNSLYASGSVYLDYSSVPGASIHGLYFHDTTQTGASLEYNRVTHAFNLSHYLTVAGQITAEGCFTGTTSMFSVNGSLSGEGAAAGSIYMPNGTAFEFGRDVTSTVNMYVGDNSTDNATLYLGNATISRLSVNNQLRIEDDVKIQAGVLEIESDDPAGAIATLSLDTGQQLGPTSILFESKGADKYTILCVSGDNSEHNLSIGYEANDDLMFISGTDRTIGINNASPSYSLDIGTDDSSDGIVNAVYIYSGGVDYGDHTHTGYAVAAEFDDHTGDTTIHFTEASIDHGSIAGLDDDDHTLYEHTGHTHTELTNDLIVQNFSGRDISVNYDEDDTAYSRLWFHDGASSTGMNITYDIAGTQFSISDSVNIGGTWLALDPAKLYLNNASSPNKDAYLYMYSDTEDKYLNWDNDNLQFILSHKLNVNGVISGTSYAGIKHTKAITVIDPQVDDNIAMFFTDDAITITQTTVVNVGSSPSVTWEVRTFGTRNAAGDLINSGTSTSTTTPTQDTSMLDSSVPANYIVWLEIPATGGTSVDEFHLTIEYVMA